MSLPPAIDCLSLDADEDEHSQELSTIATIFPELHILTPHTATISLPVAPICPLRVTSPRATVLISHFPPITIHFTLPPAYPSDSPPRVTLSTSPSWIPGPTLDGFTTEINALWEEYGRSSVIFTIIDHVQQSSERAFGLPSSLELPADLQDALTAFDRRTKQERFNDGTYDCGICLEPRKGAVCHRLRSCGHVFCRPCLREYYSACINEGDVCSVGCIDPKCKRAQKGGAVVGLTATLPPGELLEIGISTELVARYEALKLKGALEKDPDTIWCPRMWCQAASRESIEKLNEIMKVNHVTYYLADLPDGVSGPPEKVDVPVKEVQTEDDKKQKLHVCSKCGLAFCRVCYAGWHGDLQICRAKNAQPTEEEIANEEYLKNNTTPCPTCTAPVLKSHGCNHLICKCETHFCYLCSSFLDAKSPYEHFNKRGTDCYMRLWEGEGGDGEHARLMQEGLIDENGEEIHVAPQPPAAAAPRRPRNVAPDRNQGIGVVEVRWNGNIRAFVEEANQVFDDDLEFDVSDGGDWESEIVVSPRAG